MDEDNRKYFSELKTRIDEAYDLAKKARSLNLDPAPDVESMPAGDLATRVEGLVGPPGIAEKIKEIGRDSMSQIAKIADTILGDKPPLSVDEMQKKIDQALRTSLAILTEGVVAAPIEGIADVKVKKNPDGSGYLSVYFSGPIRSAGGTAQGLAVVMADYIRNKMGLRGYRPTNDEVERYVEEIKLYHERASRLQYMPADEDIRTIVKNMAVCVDGDPTEEMEVSIHRDLERVETNRIRGGMCLVIAEGVAQKSKKVIKYAGEINLDWGWLSPLGQQVVSDDEESGPLKKFMEEIVGGRPIFAAPSAHGGFRLRYGRSRISGISAKSIHPATMILLDDFIATGTQLKIERPGKGCIITPCDSIDGPIVKLADGSVVLVEDEPYAREIKKDVSEILFLGDMLIPYGDFLQTNTPLLPAGYCEEWWNKEIKEKTGIDVDRIPTPEEAIKVSLGYGIPLHPHYTYYWGDLSAGDIRVLADWLLSGEMGDRLVLKNTNPGAKRVLELLGVPHKVEGGRVFVGEYLPLLYSLGLYDGGGMTEGRFVEVSSKVEGKSSALSLVNELSGIRIMDKTGAYIGCRMGRPEKARERKMQPEVHALFPVGDAGGRERSVNAASENNSIVVEAARMQCLKCGSLTTNPRCPECGGNAIQRMVCPSCGWIGGKEKCPKCGRQTRFYGQTDLNIKKLWSSAVEKIGRSTDVKGVRGMISEYKIPEPLEKGLLRAINGVSVFKDGTIRFDATNAPLTHFKPKEIGTDIEKLKRIGYAKDYLGREVTGEDQIIELRVQDIIIPSACADYLVKVAGFMDQLLSKFYGIKPYYNINSKEDLVGELVLGLAPHTSAGVVGRIVGYTKTKVCYAHPYWHAAKRRDADGDEDSIMLILDALINFSRKYLPEKRGGRMDAPLVVITILDPKEIDDQAHKMEVVGEYPIEFYKKTWEKINPSEAGVKVVGDMLDDNSYSGLLFTHNTSDIVGPVVESQYVKLKTMEEKVDAQLAVAEKIRAVSARDVAELVINAHFLRDTYGNLRAFSRQHVRCVKCNANYRRPPLVGKCTKCGSRLILTVSEGNIRKYLETSKRIAEKYNLSNYLKQRLMLIERDINSLVTNDLAKQASLADYM